VGTTKPRIVERTGICERHIADSCDGHFRPALEAAKAALACRGHRRRELDQSSPARSAGHALPATATLVQEGLGARRALGFDLNAACCGFLYGSGHRRAMVAMGSYRKVLVIGATPMSRFVRLSGSKHLHPVWRTARRHLLEATGASDDAGAGFHRFSGRVMALAPTCRELRPVATVCRRSVERAVEAPALHTPATGRRSQTRQGTFADFDHNFCPQRFVRLTGSLDSASGKPAHPLGGCRNGRDSGRSRS